MTDQTSDLARRVGAHDRILQVLISELGQINEGQVLTYEMERDTRSGKESAVQLRASETA